MSLRKMLEVCPRPKAGLQLATRKLDTFRHDGTRRHEKHRVRAISAGIWDFPGVFWTAEDFKPSIVKPKKPVPHLRIESILVIEFAS